MPSDPDSSLPPAGRLPVSPPGGEAPRPTLACRARTLLERQGTASLATLLAGDAGAPFASLVPCAVDAEGRPVLVLSALAVHTRNLVADPRASLLVAAERGAGARDPLASLRISLQGRLERVGAEERIPLRQRFLDRHPEAERWVDLGDFAIWRMQVARVWVVAGFGEMGWVSAAELAAAEIDPLDAVADGILAHMNADHRDALVLYCQALAGLAAESATMTGIDRLGFDLEASGPGGTVCLRLPFRREVRTSDEARASLVALVREARSAPGAASDRRPG